MTAGFDRAGASRGGGVRGRGIRGTLTVAKGIAGGLDALEIGVTGVHVDSVVLVVRQ
jgi:hypothetical protein